MSKFTNGPYRYEYDNSDSSGGGCWYEIQDADGSNLLWFPYRASEEEREEKEATACLLHAAPDLYEALVTLDEAYCACGRDMSSDDRAFGRMALIKARAALAKAKGDVK